MSGVLKWPISVEHCSYASGVWAFPRGFFGTWSGRVRTGHVWQTCDLRRLTFIMGSPYLSRSGHLSSAMWEEGYPLTNGLSRTLGRTPASARPAGETGKLKADGSNKICLVKTGRPWSVAFFLAVPRHCFVYLFDLGLWGWLGLTLSVTFLLAGRTVANQRH